MTAFGSYRFRAPVRCGTGRWKKESGVRKGIRTVANDRHVKFGAAHLGRNISYYGSLS